jgi:hypothetical protein
MEHSVRIINALSFEGGCFSGSALAVDCRVIVISILNAVFQGIGSLFSIKKKKQLPLFIFFSGAL